MWSINSISLDRCGIHACAHALCFHPDEDSAHCIDKGIRLIVYRMVSWFVYSCLDISIVFLQIRRTRVDKTFSAGLPNLLCSPQHLIFVFCFVFLPLPLFYFQIVEEFQKQCLISKFSKKFFWMSVFNIALLFPDFFLNRTKVEPHSIIIITLLVS